MTSLFYEGSSSKVENVLLYDYKLHIFPGKLKSRWNGPYVVKEVFLMAPCHSKSEDSNLACKHPSDIGKCNFKGVKSLGARNQPVMSHRYLARYISVDPQFCPSTLTFILWVSPAPIVLIWHTRAPFGLSRCPSLVWACLWSIVPTTNPYGFLVVKQLKTEGSELARKCKRNNGGCVFHADGGDFSAEGEGTKRLKC
ncbi:hypothetical protein CK203_045622 [Vitis vinifera]|uniref:Uncharacterized protein n=1 Tax=Vitis vinifera TaxID=29760 RepID=A0A438HQ14_VITVI|nr:hypothetical protein CK203_045622 [Vitis vinifera]